MTQLPLTEIMSIFDGIIGQDDVKNLVSKIVKHILRDRMLEENLADYSPANVILNFILTGNPATGKTTIARLIGKAFQRAGVFSSLEEDVVTEITGFELNSYSSTDVKKLFEENIGKVLFIDEAYCLLDNPNVVLDIMENISAPAFHNKLSVIMAGHPKHMEKLLDGNLALQRRFYIVPLRDYSNEELYQILINKVCLTPNLEIDAEECRQVGVDYFSSLPRDNYFGNIREVDNLLYNLRENKDSRTAVCMDNDSYSSDSLSKITKEDFPRIKK